MNDPIEKPKRGRPRNLMPKADPGPVQALDRGVTILLALAGQQGVALSELARQVEMPPSTAHRILATLQTHRFVDFDPQTQHWFIGIGAFRVGNAYLQRTNLAEAAQAVMRRLTEQTGETANLGIADQGFIVFISQVETQNPIRAMFRAGARSQMHASGIGKAMLAHMPRKTVEAQIAALGQPEFTPFTLTKPAPLYAELDRIAATGWAVDNEERYLGMRCIAASVFNALGDPVAGLSVSGPSARFSDAMIARTGPLVRAAADELTALTGGLRPERQDTNPTPPA